MEIELSGESGFCFGVTDAVERTVSLKGEDVYLLLSLIHI